MSVEVFEGKTIEEALQKAADAFGVSVEELEHEEAEEKTDDFWGLGAKVYSVRAWVAGQQTEEVAAPAPEEAAVEADPEPDRAEATTAGSFFGAEVVGEAATETVPEFPAVEPAALTERDGEEAAPAEAVAQPEQEPEQTSAIASEDAAEPAAAADGEDAPVADGSLEDATAALLKTIFAAMDFDCTAEARIEGEVLQVAISGEDNQFLLDGRGRGLGALELILNHAFRHRPVSERKKIRVDAGDFRSRREDEIRDLAYQVAHQAKETDTVQETQPLNPYERRIVHLTLADDQQVTTRSQGTGFLKAVSVIPSRDHRR